MYLSTDCNQKRLEHIYILMSNTTFYFRKCTLQNKDDKTNIPVGYLPVKICKIFEKKNLKYIIICR